MKLKIAEWKLQEVETKESNARADKEASEKKYQMIDTLVTNHVKEAKKKIKADYDDKLENKTFVLKYVFSVIVTYFAIITISYMIPDFPIILADINKSFQWIGNIVIILIYKLIDMCNWMYLMFAPINIILAYLIVTVVLGAMMFGLGYLIVKNVFPMIEKVIEYFKSEDWNSKIIAQLFETYAIAFVYVQTAIMFRCSFGMGTNFVLNILIELIITAVVIVGWLFLKNK